MHVRSMDWTDRDAGYATCCAAPPLPPNAAACRTCVLTMRRLARVVREEWVTAPHSLTLGPSSGGNLHRFSTGQEPAVLFDVLTPPYDFVYVPKRPPCPAWCTHPVSACSGERPCTYYEEVGAGQEGNAVRLCAQSAPRWLSMETMPFRLQ